MRKRAEKPQSFDQDCAGRISGCTESAFADPLETTPRELGSLLANASRPFGGGLNRPLTLPNLRTDYPRASCVASPIEAKGRKCKEIVRRNN